MNERVRLILASILILAAVVMTLRSCGTGRRQLAVSANSLEEALAHQAGRLVRDSVEASGEIVFMQAPALDDLGMAMNKRIRAAFDDGLGRRARDVEEIDLAAGRSREEFLAAAALLYNGRWGGMVAEWAQAHPDAAAIVSLNPLPQELDPAQLAGLPPLFSVLPMTSEEDAQELVSHLGLGAGLLPREAISRPGAVPRKGSPEVLFNVAYQVITP